MGHEDDADLRISAQRALLGHVVPSLRAVSLDIIPLQHRILIRFVFDAQPHDSVRDVVGCAATEIIADYPDGWEISEEIVICPAPMEIDDLRLRAYRRCEDAWVTGR